MRRRRMQELSICWRSTPMTFKERVEANAVFWLLGCLLTGFLSGISAYRAVQDMAGLEPVAKSDYRDLQKRAEESESRAKALQSELDRAKTSPKVQGSLAPPRTSIQPIYPKLKGVSIRIWFPNASTSKASEIADKLEKLGMAVKLSHREAKVDQSLESVYYFKNGYASAAVKVSDALHSYGFRSTRFEDSTESTDLVIWLWPH
jgi:hypothetical protein